MKPYLTFYIDMIMTTDRKSEFCTIVSDQSNYDQTVRGYHMNHVVSMLV